MFACQLFCFVPLKLYFIFNGSAFCVLPLKVELKLLALMSFVINCTAHTHRIAHGTHTPTYTYTNIEWLGSKNVDTVNSYVVISRIDSSGVGCGVWGLGCGCECTSLYRQFHPKRIYEIYIWKRLYTWVLWCCVWVCRMRECDEECAVCSQRRKREILITNFVLAIYLHERFTWCVCVWYAIAIVQRYYIILRTIRYRNMAMATASTNTYKSTQSAHIHKH